MNTTFCDLRDHRASDVIPGKGHHDLNAFLSKFRGREKVTVVFFDPQ